MFWILAASMFSAIPSTSPLELQRVRESPLQGGGKFANEIMSTLPGPSRSLLLFSDVRLEDNVVLKELNQERGLQVMDIKTEEKNQRNLSQSQLSQTFKFGRQFRRASWNVVVVVASENIEFLRTFAIYSLQNRLLVWSSRVIVVTSLTQHDLKQLLSSHWTFSMMNVIVLNQENEGNEKWSVYTHLPYAQSGPQVFRLAVLMGNQELRYTSNVGFFPEKFKNFNGAAVKIAKLDHFALWRPVTETARDGKLVERIVGNDYQLFIAVAKALNFTYKELPLTTWPEVYDKISKREAFIIPLQTTILETRLEHFDYTMSYCDLRLIFVMAKPTTTANWMSLYSPLSNYVWLSVLILTILMPLIYMQVTRSEILLDPDEQKSIGWTAFTVFGVLVGQPQSGRLPKYDASRLAILAWFIFTFVVSTGYQGNLTAHLTLPKYPPRPETLEELVNYVDRITIPSWGTDYKNSFKKSTDSIMRKIGDLLYVGVQPKEGLQQTLTERQAHVGVLIGMTLVIDEHFTRRDGTPRLYIGKESVIPGTAAWPVPHDAPFTHNLDWCLQAIIEGGLYEKWTDESLRFFRYENLRKKKEQWDHQKTTGEAYGVEEVHDEDEDGGNRPLTLRHMQGTFGLFAIGIVASICIFFVEMCFMKIKI